MEPSYPFLGRNCYLEGGRARHPTTFTICVRIIYTCKHSTPQETGLIARQAPHRGGMLYTTEVRWQGQAEAYSTRKDIGHLIR